MRRDKSTIYCQVPRWLRYAWAAPTTAVGLLFLVLAPVFGRIGARVVAGVLELHGGAIAFFLSRCTLLPGGARAMTLGHVVLGLDPRALEITREHERVHVRQCERWGPFFLPAYVGVSLLLWLQGRAAYEDNPFEREAFDQTPALRRRRRGGHADMKPSSD